MCCARTTDSIIMRPSQNYSPAILVFPHQIEPHSSRGIPSPRASNGRGVSKCRRIDPRPVNNCPLMNDRESENPANESLLVGRNVRNTTCTSVRKAFQPQLCAALYHSDIWQRKIALTISPNRKPNPISNQKPHPLPQSLLQYYRNRRKVRNSPLRPRTVLA